MVHRLPTHPFTVIASGLLLLAVGLVAPLADRRSSVPHGAGIAPAAGSLIFERNDGQHRSGVRFMARGAGYRLAMLEGQAALALSTGNGPIRLAMTFDGARSGIRPQGERPAVARANYFVGRDPRAWRTDVPTFERVRYAQLYDGIDLVFYGNGGQLEYDVIVAPGARPGAARFRFDDAQSVQVAADGSLALGLPHGELRYTKPIAYQMKDGARRTVDVAYRIDGAIVTFEAGAYDRSRELVIDPVLVFSTYLGGTATDILQGVAVDAAGATYVTGWTHGDFPISPNAPQPGHVGSDAFITKFSRDGSTLLYSTYFGGTSGDSGLGVSVDASGAAYVTGWTESVDLPVTAGAFQRDRGGSIDAFVAKLSPSGNRIAYATYLGGSRDEALTFKAGIAVDPTGIATVVGTTESDDFPTTSGALMRTHPAGDWIGYAARLNAGGTGLVFSTLLTGETEQLANAVTLDAQGRAIVVGEAVGAMTTSRTLGPRGSRDGYALKLNATGSALVFSTRFGGSGVDVARGVTYDPNRDVVFITGNTLSEDFPATGIQSRKGPSDAFLLTVTANGGGGFYSALLGGSGTDEGVAIGASGDYITIFGNTESSDFPSVRALQPYRDRGDAFVARLRGSVDILYSTTLGGSHIDTLTSGVIDGAGAATLGGLTYSTNFPVAHAVQPAHSAGAEQSDGFVARTALVPRGTPGPHDVVVHVADVATLHGDWEAVADPTAAGGARLHNPNRGRPKVDTPLASPVDYFEFTVHGLSGGRYRLWMRGKADGNAFSNDSVWVQFERAQNNGSDADDERDIFPIGTTEAMGVVIEDCANCGLRGWGWQDGGYGQKLLGTPLYFNSESAVTIRVQRREDGVSIDQIVIAKDDVGEGPNFASAPGYQKDDDTILPAQDPFGGPDIVLHTSAGTAAHGAWRPVADPTAADGEKMRNPDAGAPKKTAPLASPDHYFEMSFGARANVPYRIWIRGRADADFYGNDSAFVQFSGSIDSTGAPMWRIGTTSATTYVLEDCSGCGVQGWGWNDNGYGAGVLGPVVYFAEDGDQRIRVQTREDGLSIDQIVLSPERYLTAAPGRTKNDNTIVQ